MLLITIAVEEDQSAQAIKSHFSAKGCGTTSAELIMATRIEQAIRTIPGNPVSCQRTSPAWQVAKRLVDLAARAKRTREKKLGRARK